VQAEVHTEVVGNLHSSLVPGEGRKGRMEVAYIPAGGIQVVVLMVVELQEDLQDLET
jgi:hypothetical protein